MSGINGDKARFHRGRKKKIAKRLRTRELVDSGGQSTSITPASGSRPKGAKQ